MSQHYEPWEVRQTATIIMHADEKPCRIIVYNHDGDPQASFYAEEKVAKVIMRLLRAVYNMQVS